MDDIIEYNEDMDDTAAHDTAAHDTAPNSDQEDNNITEDDSDPLTVPTCPILLSKITNFSNEPMDRTEPIERTESMEQSNSLHDSIKYSDPSSSYCSGTSRREEDDRMLCCASIRLQPSQISSTACRSTTSSSPSKQITSLTDNKKHKAPGTSSSFSCRLASALTLGSVEKLRHLSHVTDECPPGKTQTASQLAVDTSMSPSHHNSSTKLLNTSASSCSYSEPSISLATSTTTTSETSLNSSSQACTDTSPIKFSQLQESSSLTRPASSNTELVLSPDLLLAHKRKSEVERELSSPGKRVRAMPDTSASMILNVQSYNNSTSATQYGHFPVSPKTPTCRRRNSSKTRQPNQLEAWLQIFRSWDSAEKTYALNELIETCDAAHVRHIMAVIEPQFQRDFISLLPKELALYVLSFLSPKDLLKAGQTCQYWRLLAEDTLLWRQKCKQSGADLGLMFNSTQLELPAVKISPDGVTNEESINWKAVYLKTQAIEHHWRHGEAKPTKILRGHDDHVITCLEFSGNRIVSGSDDNTLKVWDVETGECLRTLVGHTGGVWSSQMRDNIVVSGSTDRTLRVWDTESGECLHTLHGHTSTVRCMHLHENIVVSGSRDATLRMWDITQGTMLHVLIGHVAAVRCVQYDGKKVVSGAYDYTVRVWHPETESCIHVLQGHTNRVYSLQFDGKHIVSGSLDTSIRVWDADTGTCLHTLIGHQSLTSGMEIQEGLLVSGNADSTVKVWDINTGACLQTLSGSNKHQGAVTCLQFTRKFVITSSDDGTVKLWSLQTGEFIRNLVTLDSGGSGGVVWRVKADNTLLVCASGSRNGTEDTKLIVLDFGLKKSQEELLLHDQTQWS